MDLPERVSNLMARNVLDTSGNPLSRKELMARMSKHAMSPTLAKETVKIFFGRTFSKEPNYDFQKAKAGSVEEWLYRARESGANYNLPC